MGACERTEELDRVVMYVARQLVAVSMQRYTSNKGLYICVMDRDKGQRISKTAWTCCSFRYMRMAPLAIYQALFHEVRKTPSLSLRVYTTIKTNFSIGWQRISDIG
jgi:hypothetical protein